MTEPLIIGLEIAVIVLILAAAGWLIRNKRVQKRPTSSRGTSIEASQNLHEIIQQRQAENPGKPIDLELEDSTYTLQEGLRFTTPFHIKGKGLQHTQIVSEGGQPAIRVDNTKNCSITGVHIKGAIQCNKGEVLVENCHIDANEDGVCIEAYDGSVVTFSGTVNSEGGIAIHAKGDSKVILKPPYTLSPDEYVVFDPHSRVSSSERKS